MVQRVIHKYVLEDRPGIQVLNFTPNAYIIDVQLQNNDTVMWAVIDPSMRLTESRAFLMLTTGVTYDLADGYELVHLATLQHGGFVKHVFELYKVNWPTHTYTEDRLRLNRPVERGGRDGR